MTGLTIILLILIALTIIAVAMAALRLREEARVQRRMREAGEVLRSQLPDEDEKRGVLGDWLFRAGFRHPLAEWLFLLAVVVMLVLGLSIAYVLLQGGFIAAGTMALGDGSTGLGALLVPLVMVLPWLLVVILVAVPFLVVAGNRRRLVAQAEFDLPLYLELLAALCHAGLSLDMAVQRILKTQRVDRVLGREFRTMQKEILAGRGRVNAMRRSARRIDVYSYTIFTSAIIQAEQLGASIAEALRGQAETIRQRRRDMALSRAMSAPSRLLLPLALCFLPAMFLFALGPSLFYLLQFLEQMMSQTPG